MVDQIKMEIKLWLHRCIVKEFIVHFTILFSISASALLRASPAFFSYQKRGPLLFPYNNISFHWVFLVHAEHFDSPYILISHSIVSVFLNIPQETSWKAAILKISENETMKVRKNVHKVESLMLKTNEYSMNVLHVFNDE